MTSGQIPGCAAGARPCGRCCWSSWSRCWSTCCWWRPTRTSVRPGRRDGPPSAGDNVPAAVRDGGPVLDPDRAQPHSYRLSDAHDRADLRRRTGSDVDAADPGQSCARYHVHGNVLRGRLAGRPLSRTWPAGSSTTATRSASTRSPTRTSTRSRRGGATWSTRRPRWRSRTPPGSRRRCCARRTRRRPTRVDDADWQVMRQIGGAGLPHRARERRQRRLGPARRRRRSCANATPAGRTGAIVLMHDAGGDRAQTVAALDRYIPAMQAARLPLHHGLRRRCGALAAPVNVAAPPADAVARAGARLDRPGGRRPHCARCWWLLLIVVGALTLLRTLLLFGVAARHARRRRSPTWSWGPPVDEPVSVIVPAFNEQRHDRRRRCGPSPRRRIQTVEVIVVDDESTDGTAEIVEALGLDNVRVVRVPSGGKATALNAGVALARHDLIVMVDADTIVDPDAMHRARPAVRRSRRSARSPATSRSATGAGCSAGGSTSNTSSASTSTGGSTTRSGCIPTIPGALGAFRRQALQRRRRAQPRHPRRGHRPDHGDPARPAGGSSTRRPRARAHRGAGHAAAAVATAVPVELRHHAGDVEAPPVDRRTRAVRPVRPARPAVDRPVHRRAAAVRAVARRAHRLRRALPRPLGHR